MRTLKYYKYFMFLLISSCYFLVYYRYQLIILSKVGIYDSISTANSQLFNDKAKTFIEFESKCECRKDNKIRLEKNSSFYKIYSTSSANSSKLLYNLTLKEFENSFFTCDFYKTLLRGKKQKVIGYSLYGKDQRYYEKLINLSRLVRIKYPGWLMRIYYDAKINKSILCELDCLRDEKGAHLDNIDLCNVENLPFKNTMHTNWSMSYLHAMMWRWLPIGDSFVDIFSSRDLDSLIIQREIDSVHFWLQSNKIAHIMRDHPGHGTEVLGGMWDFNIEKDRVLAFHFFNLIVNSKIYNYDRSNRKGSDQDFLSSWFVFWIFKDNSIVHDSFTCEKFGGIPFPTQRQGNCFIGSPHSCNISESFDICPIKCRSKEHLNWTSC